MLSSMYLQLSYIVTVQNSYLISSYLLLRFHSADACIVYFFHSSKSSLNAYTFIHIILESLIQGIDRPRYGKAVLLIDLR